MKRHHQLVSLLLFFVFLVVSGCGRSSSDDAPADQALIEKTLVEFSAALAQGDSARLRALTGQRFALLDEGRFYNFTELLASIKPILATGTMTRTPADFHTEVRGNVAWSRYRVSGEFKASDFAIPLALLETAVLERVEERWKIMQVSTVPEATNPAPQP